MTRRRFGGLRPFFPFYGSKWRYALSYPVPRFELLVEPFAGAAGYATQHHWAKVVLVERDPVIASVWRFLLTATPRQVLALPDVAHDQDLRDLDLPPAERALIGYWLNPANAYPANRPSTWHKTHPHRVWGRRVRERLADQIGAIRHWSLVEGEWYEGPEGPATRFVDPPYVRAGYHYRHGPEGIDYAQLAEACRSWPGQVIACEQLGAAWLPFREHARRRAMRGYTDEVVWP